MIIWFDVCVCVCVRMYNCVELDMQVLVVGWLVVFYGISKFVGYLITNLVYTYVVHSISFQTFFVQAFKIVVDS